MWLVISNVWVFVDSCEKVENLNTLSISLDTQPEDNRALQTARSL